MKKINNKIIAPIVVIGLFCACSSDENVYYSDAVIESEINASAVENSRLNRSGYILSLPTYYLRMLHPG